MPRHRITNHVQQRIAEKGITLDEVEFICDAYSNSEYDSDNDSYVLSGRVARGELCVPVTARSFDRPIKVVKTAYWANQRPVR